MVTKIAGIKLEKFRDCKVTAGFFRSEFFFFENESSMSYGHRVVSSLLPCRLARRSLFLEIRGGHLAAPGTVRPACAAAKIG